MASASLSDTAGYTRFINDDSKSNSNFSITPEPEVTIAPGDAKTTASDQVEKSQKIDRTDAVHSPPSASVRPQLAADYIQQQPGFTLQQSYVAGFAPQPPSLVGYSQQLQPPAPPGCTPQQPAVNFVTATESVNTNQHNGALNPPPSTATARRAYNRIL
jgi:hypothetical protein